VTSENTSFPEGGRTPSAHAIQFSSKFGPPTKPSRRRRILLAWIDRLEADLKNATASPWPERIKQLNTARCYRRLALLLPTDARWALSFHFYSDKK
jgi:hypothetical protein